MVSWFGFGSIAIINHIIKFWKSKPEHLSENRGWHVCISITSAFSLHIYSFVIWNTPYLTVLESIPLLVIVFMFKCTKKERNLSSTAHICYVSQQSKKWLVLVVLVHPTDVHLGWPFFSCTSLVMLSVHGTVKISFWLFLILFQFINQQNHS